MGLISFLKEKFSKKKNENTDSYTEAMAKSRQNFSNRLKTLSKTYKKVNQEYFEELEEILIESDIGVNLTLKIIDEVLKISKERKISDAEEINEILIDHLFEGYMSKGESLTEVRFQENGPTVLLVVGVNGVGKTTTIAKLANRYLEQGKSVLLVAADTFRAGACEQLKIWGERLNIEVVTGPYNSDPSSVAFDGLTKAKNEGIDLAIIDVSGRLHNKQYLMDELSKLNRVIGKCIPGAPHETFLIIDATTGQNGVVQAKAFAEICPLTGVVITKMDGTSKGGIILAIRDELGVPVRFTGLGEKMTDLKEFDLESYIYGLCVGE